MRKTITTLLTVAGAVAALTMTASAATELRFAHYGAPADVVTKAGEMFKDLVAKKTGGAVVVKVYPGHELGDNKAMVQGARMGTVDISCTGNPYFTGFAPVLNVIDLPFLFQSDAHVEKVMDGPIGKELGTKVEQYNLKILAFWEIGFRNLSNSKRAVVEPADVKGLKIRTTPNPAHVLAFKILGANPTPMDFAELYTAMQTGTVDGQENPTYHTYANRFQEVQKFMSITRHAYTASPVAMNLNKFKSLPADQQNALIEAAIETAKFGRKLNQELDIGAIGKLREAGMQVEENPNSAAFRDLVAAETRKVYVEAHGGDILDKIVAAGK